MRISDWSSDGCFSDLTEQAVEPLAGDGGIGDDEAAAVVAVELGDGAVEAVAGEIDLAAAPCERAVDRRWRRGRMFDRRIVGDEAARPGPEPEDRKSTRLNSSQQSPPRMPSSAW